MTTPAFAHTFAFDAATGLVKRAVAQAAVTATGYIGTQLDQGAAAMTDMVLVVNIEAIDLASTNEVYNLRIIGSNVADRSDGTILGTVEFGDASTIGAWETRDTVAGDRHVLYFRTEKDAVTYRYVDLHLEVEGTTPSVTFNAYLSKAI